MFHYFFDSTPYEDDVIVDVFKVECILLGVATIRFSPTSSLSHEDLWNLLIKYGESLDLMPENIRPKRCVYEKLVYDQFKHFYSYFSNKENLEKQHLKVEIVKAKRQSDPNFAECLKSMSM